MSVRPALGLEGLHYGKNRGVEAGGNQLLARARRLKHRPSGCQREAGGVMSIVDRGIGVEVGA